MGQASNQRATIATVREDDVTQGPHYGNTNFDSGQKQTGRQRVGWLSRVWRLVAAKTTGIRQAEFGESNFGSGRGKWASTPRPVKERPRMRLTMLGTPGAALGAQFCPERLSFVTRCAAASAEVRRDRRVLVSILFEKKNGGRRPIGFISDFRFLQAGQGCNVEFRQGWSIL
jgi:hypothetical protein